jgi:hypothetical protein
MNVVGWNREERRGEEGEEGGKKGKGEERTCGQFEGKSQCGPNPWCALH